MNAASGSPPAAAPAAGRPHLHADPRRRRARLRRLRAAAQLVTFAVTLAIGAQFALWVRGLEQGRVVGERPPGVEGFLPISALISLRDWLLAGEPSRVHPAGLVIFLLALASALVLRKAFCAWICPVGTLAEWLGALGRRLGRGLGRRPGGRLGRRALRLPRWLDAPLRGIKYLLAGFFVWSVFVQMSPPQLRAFLESPYNKVADVKMLHFFLQPSPLTLQVLGVLVLLSIALPFFWCRYLCPYGALLGLFGSASPLQVTREPAACIDCRLCTEACPAYLPVSTSRRVRSPECTGCLDCVAVCPARGALDLAAPRLPGRRGARGLVRPAVFALLVLGLFYGGIHAAKLAGFWHSSVSTAEFQRRVRELDAPQYNHFRGRVPEHGPGD